MRAPVDHIVPTIVKRRVDIPFVLSQHTIWVGQHARKVAQHTLVPPFIELDLDMRWRTRLLAARTL